jgi:benzylsuccinate CoA-transferase BbsF subunit
MARQVLEGIKVADFTTSVAGPLTAQYLAHHGAEVIKIESGTRMDISRVVMPYKDNIPGPDRSPGYTHSNSNKYGVTLNLRHPRGSEVAKRIVAWADIVIENFRAGVMERLGLGYQEVIKVKPDIIMMSLSMQGQTGPHANHGGYGSQLPALVGIANLCGWPDRLPAFVYGAYTDLTVPHVAVTILLAALDYRRRSGKGQFIDCSQYEIGVHFLGPLLLDYLVNGREASRMGNRCPYAVPHGVYRCRGDDRWCSIAVFSDEEWQNLCRVMDNPKWTEQPKFATLLGRKENEEELDKLIERWTISYSAEEVMTWLQGAGVPAGVVENAEDLLNDPQLNHRHHFWILDHPEIGKHVHDGPSFRLSKTPGELRMSGPCLGQHNEYVYTKILGMSDEEFVELLSDGVFE